MGKSGIASGFKIKTCPRKGCVNGDVCFAESLWVLIKAKKKKCNIEMFLVFIIVRMAIK